LGEKPVEVVIGVIGGPAQGVFGVVIGIELAAHSHLLAIVQTTYPLGADFGPAQRRQQHGGQNGDDGDDHQQFNQGEGGRFAAGAILVLQKAHARQVHSTFGGGRQTRDQ
jgi:hypothetical protein